MGDRAMRYCPYCGAEIDRRMRFCPSCGNKNVATRPCKNRAGWWILLAFLFIIFAFVGAFWLFGFPSSLQAITDIIPELPKGSQKGTVAFSDDTNAIQQASKSVVMLNCYDKDGKLFATGSAFAAIEDGIFITNYHVISGDAYRITAQSESGNSFSVQYVAAYSEQDDIAILRTSTDTGVNVLPLGSSDKMEKGEKVTAIGSPLGLINTISTGVFSAAIIDEGARFLQFSAAISQGSSGGALFNEQGEVIGITSASFIDGQNLNLAIPIEKAIELWNHHIPEREMRITDYYNQWDHIKTYSVEDVLSHGGELIGKDIYVEGYISSIDYGARNGERILDGTLYLVSLPSDILGYVFLEGAEWDYSNNNRQAQETMRSFNLACFPILSINRNEVGAFSPGDYVKVCCRITRFEASPTGGYWVGSRYISISEA